MSSFFYRHRVRYRECDPMGVVYHGHYVDYLEYARTEALREVGLPYKRLEDSGVMMPVVDLSLKFLYPARYDDLIEVETRLADEIPVARIEISYDVRVIEGANVQTGDDPRLAATGSVSLCFLNARSGRPQRAPEQVVQVFKSMIAGR